MRRATGKRAGYLTTVALMVAVLATFGLSGPSTSSVALAVGSHAVVTHAPVPLAVPHKAAPVHAAPHPGVGPVSAVVSYTVPVTGYIHLPFTLSFSAAITNATVVHYKDSLGAWHINTWINVQVRDVAAVCQGGYGLTHQCPTVVNISLNDSVTNGSTSWSTVITTDALMAAQFHVTCPNAPCSYASVLPNDQYQIFAWVNINNTVNNASFGTEATGYLITAAPSATLLSPVAGAAISTGNTTVGITYTGSYVGGVVCTIYAGSNWNGKIVFTQGLFAPGAGPHTVIAASAWFVATAGPYYAVVNITTPYGVSSFGSNITAVPAGITVYSNSSSYSNQTVWGGMNPGVVGALLLVAGLVIGMIVALALGRSMWGSPKPAPAQAWQSKSTNECSVCHQTFATEAELKDHQKSAHGM